MAVYREGYKIIEMIEQQSRNIFPDAADFGVLVKKNDFIWNAAKQLVDWYGIEGTRKLEKYGTGLTLTNRIELMDEWAVADERKTEEEATEIYEVVYIKCSSIKNADGFIYVNKVK